MQHLKKRTIAELALLFWLIALSLTVSRQFKNEPQTAYNNEAAFYGINVTGTQSEEAPLVLSYDSTFWGIPDFKQ
jgi:hypothetical protein